MDCAPPPALAAAAVLPPPPLPGVAQEQVQIPPSSTANHTVVPSLDDDDNFDVDARLHSLRMRKLELEVQLESVSSASSQQLTY